MRPWLRVNRSTSRAVSRQGRRWITYAGSCCTAPFEATMAASEVAHAQTFQGPVAVCPAPLNLDPQDRKSTRLNSSHVRISYAVFCLKQKITAFHYHHDC